MTEEQVLKNVEEMINKHTDTFGEYDVDKLVFNILKFLKENIVIKFN